LGSSICTKIDQKQSSISKSFLSMFFSCFCRFGGSFWEPKRGLRRYFWEAFFVSKIGCKKKIRLQLLGFSVGGPWVP
jgi:hypothetical protein